MSEQGREIWVFSEAWNLALELLGKGRQLADKIGTGLVAVSVGSQVGVEEYIRCGADSVLSIANPTLNEFHADTYVDALSSLANERNPDLILIGATRNGLELAPRLAERLKTGCITRAVKLETDAAKEFIVMDRFASEGTTIETQISRTKPQIATVAKGIFSAPIVDPTRKGKVIQANPNLKPPTVRVIDRKLKNVDSSETSTIVCFGSGVKRREDLVVIEEFAKTLNAGVMCTGPATDLGWLPRDGCVGSALQTVVANLCVACEISDEADDVAGIAKSKVIIAIDRNPHARIFGFSDYAVVADVQEFLPQLSKKIRSFKRVE